MTGTFTIEAGQHHCRPRYPYIFHGSEMSRVVRFDPSCIYKGLPDGKEPVNKLFGFCEMWPSLLNHQAGRPLHHLASARFGWNCDEKGQLWLYGYSYADGERETKRIWTAKPDQEIKCIIGLHKNGSPGNHWYTFAVQIPSEYGYNQVRGVTKRSAAGSRAFGYGLFPYFGGSGTCPHKMKISLARP